ncbi:MAG: type II toxin-antitoxin system VapC family toxin [Proteobacteria bacterium]|nr:type II toxin-antitoxin system VapC family toxin [Desulfobulbaceae bacterium]MBU4152765.1 type II toxin-antitoxin system VapC family toxin [Pseudomonadota bacterium]
MTAVDTNILVRLLTGDDPAQCQKARQIFERHEVFIPDTVILETEWVLRFAYQFTPATINSAFTKLLGLPNVSISRPDLMAKALEWHQKGLDFADALHLAASQEHSSFLTFDTKLVKRAKGISGCRVELP